MGIENLMKVSGKEIDGRTRVPLYAPKQDSDKEPAKVKKTQYNPNVDFKIPDGDFVC